jgi:hypothetical protein
MNTEQNKTMDYELTKEDIAVLSRLRAEGCAVCVFLPQEMPDSDTRRVEDAMCEAGWNQINFDAPYRIVIGGRAH